MAEEKMFKAALEAIDQGQTARARDLFTRLLRSDSSKAEYWLWMSTLVDTNQERIYCLESALRADPGNESAKRGLIILGARQADKDVTPAPLFRRHWEKELEEVVAPSKSVFQHIWDNRSTRLASIIGAAIVVVGLIIGSIIGLRPQAEPIAIYKVSPYPTRTPSPTVSPTITLTPIVRSPTPALLASTPLWVFLSETYTPVPLYINTPHPVIEAYRAGVHAYEHSDWASMLVFMEQAITAQPNSPDLLYYTGESYRLLGRYQEAVNAYGQALQINPHFAPAYVGRALAYEKINPKSDIEGELSYAIDYDPNYVDAYLVRARIRIEHKNAVGAMDDLSMVEKLFPNHPMVYVLRALAYLELNDVSTAMENAIKGYKLDITSLPAYYSLAKAYLANQDNQKAIYYIDIYLVYILDDADSWAVKAQAEYQVGNLGQALYASGQGIANDPENAASWYYHGLVLLEQGDSHTAVNDLITAVNLDMLNFDYSVALGKALWADQRLVMAIRQFNSAETLAGTDNQLAVIYYNRAMLYEQASEFSDAFQDWSRLLALPAEAVPVDWRNYAQERWNQLNPATETEVPTDTPGPTETSTPIPTDTPIPTATLTPRPIR